MFFGRTDECCAVNRERQIVEQIRQVLLRVGDDLAGYRVFLFGSRATGEAGDRSDFDVGILGSERLPLRVFYKIDDMFDNIETLYSIDLVDMSDVSSSFRHEALRKTEVLYG